MARIFFAILALAAFGTTPQQTMPAARISGRVLAMNTNVPIAGATVTIRRADANAQTSTNVTGRDWSLAAKSDELGAFALDGLDPGTYFIIATAGGYFPADATPNRPQGFGRMLTLA